MAQGDAFSMTPKVVEVSEPAHHNIITAADSMKKEYLNVSATPMERFKLKFPNLTSAERTTLQTHFSDQYGGFASFIWQSVPAYIGGGSNITGRWVDGSLQMVPNGHTHWACSVIFEKNV